MAKDWLHLADMLGWQVSMLAYVCVCFFVCFMCFMGFLCVFHATRQKQNTKKIQNNCDFFFHIFFLQG